MRRASRPRRLHSARDRRGRRARHRPRDAHGCSARRAWPPRTPRCSHDGRARRRPDKGRRCHGRDRLAIAAARRVQEARRGTVADSSTTRPERGLAGNDPRRRIPRGVRGRHAVGAPSISPGPHGASAARTPRRAAPAGRCACWSSWQAHRAERRILGHAAAGNRLCRRVCKGRAWAVHLHALSWLHAKRLAIRSERQWSEVGLLR